MQIYQQVAFELKSHTSLTLASIDMSQNELSNKIEYYPTVRLYTKSDKAQGKEYNQSIDKKEKLMQFILDNMEIKQNANTTIITDDL